MGITGRGVKPSSHLPVPRTDPGPSKDEAIALHNFLVSLSADPSRRVYTDASLKGRLAAYAYFAQSGTETWEFAEAIGSGSTVYPAELLAIRKAHEHGIANAGATIFCDNRAAVIRIGARPSDDPDISAIQQMAAARHVTVVRIPGHRDIP